MNHHLNNKIKFLPFICHKSFSEDSKVNFRYSIQECGIQSTRQRTNSLTPTCRRIKSSRDVGSWSSVHYNLLEVKHTEK